MTQPLDRWNHVRLSIAIQHTPRRDTDPVFLELRDALPDAQVIVDPEPTGDYSATWRTYSECLRRTPHPATHRLVLQDDVQLCRNFLAGVEAAIRSRPDSLLSLFISMRPQQSAMAHLHALERCDAWSYLDSREWVPTQALVWPAFLIGPMLRHAQAFPVAGPHNADDQVVGKFIRERRLMALQSCPSLVQHVHAEETTLDPGVNRVGNHRYAACWFGAEGETEHDPATAINWASGAW